MGSDAKLGRLYVVLLVILTLLVAASIIYETVTDFWSGQLLATAEAAAEILNGEIQNAAEVFNIGIDFLTLYIRDEGIDADSVDHAMNTSFVNIIRRSDATSAYFYNINGKSGYVAENGALRGLNNSLIILGGTDAKQSGWRTVFNSAAGAYTAAFIRPLSYKGQQLGFVGIELDREYFTAMLRKMGTGDRASLYAPEGRVLAHNQLENIVGPTDWYNRYTPYGEIFGATGVTHTDSLAGTHAAAHVRLNSGHIYILETPQGDINSHNLMFISFFLLSVVCIVLIYGKNSEGEALLDALSGKVLGDATDDPIVETRIRAAFLLHIAMTVLLLYRLICGILDNSGMIVVAIEAFCVFGACYAYLNFRLYAKYMWFSAIAIVFVPPVFTAVNLFSGGASGTMSFVEGSLTLLGVIGPIFIQQKKYTKFLFPLFSLVIFASITTLTVFFNLPLESGAYMYFSNLFFVGFALFSVMSLFSQRTDKTYDEIREAMDKLQNAQSTLVQHEKMVTLGKLIAGVAHEINTPIGAIKASAEILESSGDMYLRNAFEAGRTYDDKTFYAFTRFMKLASESFQEMRSTSEARKSRKQMRKYLEDIDIPNREEVTELLERMEVCDIEKVEENLDLFTSDNAAQAMRLAIQTLPMITSVQTALMATAKVSKIVFALKSYAHSNFTGERTDTNLPSTIETVLMLYHNQIKEHVRVVQNYQEGLPFVNANPDELSQVWTNLIQNALHAMEYSGTLTISASKKGDMIYVSIADTGKGMEQSVVDQIFEPFFTTKPMGEGSGLGLDICRRIVNSHHGEISVESVPGKGTTFTVTLPIGG